MRFNKYHAVKTTVDGITFDSKKESIRYEELKIMESVGAITDLKLQQRFLIVPKAGNNHRERYYVADFVYNMQGVKIIEDVKSPITKKNPVYTLKKALMLWQYPEYTFKES